MRASARGALVFIENRLVPAARLHDGLALVEVDSTSGVRLLQEGRPVARRARTGRPVLLTGLQPYAANRIAVRTEDLPFEVGIEEEEGVAVPGLRQAARIRFGSVRRRSPLTVALIDEDDRAIAPGLEVSAQGRRIGVTGHEGLVFLDDGGAGKVLRVAVAGRWCEARVPAAMTTRGPSTSAPIRCLTVDATP
jgi:outer membrane usher protein